MDTCKKNTLLLLCMSTCIALFSGSTIHGMQEYPEDTSWTAAFTRRIAQAWQGEVETAKDQLGLDCVSREWKKTQEIMEAHTQTKDSGRTRNDQTERQYLTRTQMAATIAAAAMDRERSIFTGNVTQQIKQQASYIAMLLGSDRNALLRRDLEDELFKFGAKQCDEWEQRAALFRKELQQLQASRFAQTQQDPPPSAGRLSNASLPLTIPDQMLLPAPPSEGVSINPPSEWGDAQFSVSTRLTGYVLYGVNNFLGFGNFFGQIGEIRISNTRRY